MYLQPAETMRKVAAKQSSVRRLNIVNAFDIENSRNALDGAQDALELLAVVNIQRNFHPRVQRFAAALKRADVRARIADRAGDAGENAGTVLGENPQAYRKRGLRGAGPFDRNAALDFIEKILHVGAALAMHRDAAPARHVTNNVVARNRRAAF